MSVAGSELLRIPRLNRGTAFTLDERERFGLIGHLLMGVMLLEAQLHRSYNQFLRAETDLDKFAFLSALRDRNTVLFYRLLSEHLEEMMPIVYTPTIGAAIVEFSQSYQRLHGVFLSIDNPDQVERSLQGQGRNPEDVDLLIVTDSEGILGIGDQGVGGIQIALGKKSLYTAAAGIDPTRAIAIVLDVATRPGPVVRPLYLGLRHSRVRGQRYDDFIEAFVTAASAVFPYAMIHWEDFGAANAHRVLTTYRDRICTFNDDVQGTAAVVAAAALAAVRSSGGRLHDQRIVIHGAGTAGVGVADLMRDMMINEGATPEQATAAFWGARQPWAAHDRARGQDQAVPAALRDATHPRPMRGRWTSRGASAWPTWSEMSGPPSSSEPPANPGPSPSASSARWPRTWTSP